MKSKLYSDKTDVIRLSFPVLTYSYFFNFMCISYSTGYTHLNAPIRSAETPL